VRSPGGYRRCRCRPSPRREPIEALRQSDAVALFIDRALAGSPELRSHRTTAPTIAQISHDLDGLSLVAVAVLGVAVMLMPVLVLLVLVFVLALVVLVLVVAK